jgi:sec-independent protein translocase protein TatB
MFDIAWSEFLVIGVVALIVIGPKELPAVLRAVGQWTTKIRRMATEFQSQFQEAMREAEMADLKKEVDNLNNVAKGVTADFEESPDYKGASKWDPKEELQRTVDSAAYPTDALSVSASTTSVPEAVTGDGYAPPPDAFAAPQATLPEAQPAGSTQESTASPGQPVAAAEPTIAIANPPATAPNVTEPAPPSAVDTAPIAGAAAHDS